MKDYQKDTELLRAITKLGTDDERLYATHSLVKRREQQIRQQTVREVLNQIFPYPAPKWSEDKLKLASGSDVVLCAGYDACADYIVKQKEAIKEKYQLGEGNEPQ